MLYLLLIILSVIGDVLVDSDVFLMTDFMNLKIKSTQSFRCANRDKIYLCVNRSECSYIYIYIYTCVSK
jgi:hypothetical protein